MTRPLPPHGTTARYISRRCRCEDCKRAGVRAQKVRSWRRSRGEELLIDATPTREHVQMLMDAGWSRTAAGTAVNSVVRVAAGQQRVRATTARAIRAVRVDSERTATLVDAGGTILRLRALQAIGWPMQRIARVAGIEDSNLTDVVMGRHGRVRSVTAERVRCAYEELWDRTPSPWVNSNSRARNRAARLGWLPPMALDDDRLDEVGYTPDVAVLAPQRHCRTAEIAELVEMGLTSQQIADRVGIRRTSVRRHLTAEQRPRLAENEARFELGRWSA